jgi:hypothetical protein
VGESLKVNMTQHTEDWDLWYPKAGATGILFGRGRLNQTSVLLVHAAPPVLTVTIRCDGQTVAEGRDLEATAETPITRLTRQGVTIVREDIWPAESDLGLPVLLAGGEVGILRQWWHADDCTEWRWQIELYNHR